MIKADYTREELVAICERAVVPLEKWGNRDTPHNHEKLGLCWVMLKAGCTFFVHRAAEPGEKSGCHTIERTIWLSIDWPGFSDFEYGQQRTHCENGDTFYLPTPAMLDERQGGDWYH